MIRVFMEVGNFDPRAQGDGVFELNPPLDVVLMVSFNFLVLGFITCHKVPLQSLLSNK